MGLEEADLMFSVDGRGISHVVHDAEVIPDSSLVDCCSRLGNQFSSAHGLAIPEGGGIQGELGAMGAARVGGILVGGVEVDVGTYGFRSMLLESASYT
jgi:hypothetical protein